MYRENTKEDSAEERLFREHLARKGKYGQAKISKTKKKMIGKSKKINRNAK